MELKRQYMSHKHSTGE